MICLHCRRNGDLCSFSTPRFHTAIACWLWENVSGLRASLGWLLKKHKTSWTCRNSSFVQVFVFVFVLKIHKFLEVVKVLQYYGYVLWSLIQKPQGAIFWVQCIGISTVYFSVFLLMLFYQDEFWKAFLLSSGAHVCDALPLASDSEHTSANSIQFNIWDVVC